VFCGLTTPGEGRERGSQESLTAHVSVFSPSANQMPHGTFHYFSQPTFAYRAGWELGTTRILKYEVVYPPQSHQDCDLVPQSSTHDSSASPTESPSESYSSGSSSSSASLTVQHTHPRRCDLKAWLQTASLQMTSGKCRLARGSSR